MRDRSLAKMYKDLLITKRDLADLKQSITNTINAIRQADGQITKIQSQRKGRQNYLPAQKIAAPFPKYRIHCQLCRIFFENKEVLVKHNNEYHEVCNKCGEKSNEGMEDHLKYACGEIQLTCEVCFGSIKKKQYDEHIKVCYFRECFKCNRQVSSRAYSYHLNHCRKNKSSNLIAPCKQLIKNKEKRSLAIPCCLVMA